MGGKARDSLRKARIHAPTFWRAHHSPCASCPYRLDASLMYWAKDHYERLLRSDNDAVGILFGCHKQRLRPDDEHQVCAGWLFDQRNRGIPSLALRLQLHRSAEAVTALHTVHDGGHELYLDTRSACLANLLAFQVVQGRDESDGRGPWE